jgi:hypothetical protein
LAPQGVTAFVPLEEENLWGDTVVPVWLEGPLEVVDSILGTSYRVHHRFSLPRKVRAIAQAVSRRLPAFEPGSGHVGFMANKVALGQGFSEYFVSPAKSHSTDCSTITIIHHPKLVQ